MFYFQLVWKPSPAYLGMFDLTDIQICSQGTCFYNSFPLQCVPKILWVVFLEKKYLGTCPGNKKGSRGAVHCHERASGLVFLEPEDAEVKPWEKQGPKGLPGIGWPEILKVFGGPSWPENKVGAPANQCLHSSKANLMARSSSILSPILYFRSVGVRRHEKKEWGSNLLSCVCTFHWKRWAVWDDKPWCYNFWWISCRDR